MASDGWEGLCPVGPAAAAVLTPRPSLIPPLPIVGQPTGRKGYENSRLAMKVTPDVRLISTISW